MFVREPVFSLFVSRGIRWHVSSPDPGPARVRFTVHRLPLSGQCTHRRAHSAVHSHHPADCAKETSLRFQYTPNGLRAVPGSIGTPCHQAIRRGVGQRGTLVTRQLTHHWHKQPARLPSALPRVLGAMSIRCQQYRPDRPNARVTAGSH